MKGAKTVSQETKEEDKPQPKVTFACASPVSHRTQTKRSQKIRPTRQRRERQVSVSLKEIRMWGKMVYERQLIFSILILETSFMILLIA